MAQADYFIANQSGALVRQDLNEQLEAIASLNSGDTAPSVTFPYMFWQNTLTDILYKRNSTNTVWEVFGGGVPIGAIIPYSPGFFTNGSNGGFTIAGPSANTIVAINTYVNPSGYYVCNGALCYDIDSPIFDGAGRYLPNWSDDRFIMGDTYAGHYGGESSSSHVHATSGHALTLPEMPPHDHQILNVMGMPGAETWFGTEYANGEYKTYITESSGGGVEHAHGDTASADAENRPLFLGCFILMRIK